MNLITVYKKIKELKLPIFKTTDLSVLLGITNKYGSKLLGELASEKLIFRLRRDLWIIKGAIDPLMVLDYLTLPAPSYVSLQSALYYHGIISQIPVVIYGVTIARTRRYETVIGTYSLHHLDPNLFFGFDLIGENNVRMAQREKALFDYFYLKSTKSKLFYKLPEMEIPENFDWQKIAAYTQKIKNKGRRNMILSMIPGDAKVANSKTIKARQDANKGHTHKADNIDQLFKAMNK
jgi:predicted transcriptional regulator of viral defense system